MSELKKIPIEEIRANLVSLRKVDKKNPLYLELVDSVGERGILNPISVREKSDKETGQVFFEVIDGLHRYSAACDSGLGEMPCQILDFSDYEVLLAQTIANVHSIETKPAQYTEQLKRILDQNPTMTQSELGRQIGKSAAFIQQRLSLNKITNPEILSRVDSGEINLSNAYALAKLPPEEQSDFVERAITMGDNEFLPLVSKRVKEIREARRKGLDASPQEFQPVAHLQKLKAIKEELETGKVGKALIELTGVKTAEEGFKLGVQWILHLDPKSVEIQKVEDENRKRVKAEKAEKKKAERAAKKAEKKKKEAIAAEEAAKQAQSALKKE